MAAPVITPTVSLPAEIEYGSTHRVEVEVSDPDSKSARIIIRGVDLAGNETELVQTTQLRDPVTVTIEDPDGEGFVFTPVAGTPYAWDVTAPPSPVG